jgi:hypothetical protein
LDELGALQVAHGLDEVGFSGARLDLLGCQLGNVDWDLLIRLRPRPLVAALRPELRGPDDRQWPLPWAVTPNGETDIDALAYQAIGPPP